MSFLHCRQEYGIYRGDNYSDAAGQAGGTAWSTGYGYSGNGHLASLSYPAGLSIAYAPNGLGQATQAGPYASGVRYHPNGAIAQFTYGNGLVHTLTQNTRQLPERSRDASAATLALDDHYDFDANANVAAMKNRGRVLRFPQVFMPAHGSCRLKSMQIYTHVAVKQLKAIHETTHPAKGRKAKPAAGAAGPTADELLAVLEAENEDEE